jgi:hypothetical protein
MDPEDSKNIIDIADARRRQQTLAKASRSKRVGDGRSARPGQPRFKIAGFPLLAWVQFFLVLAFSAYLMKSCGLR